LKRESQIDPAESITRHTGRKLDFAIIGVLAVAVVLLLTDRFVLRHGVSETTAAPIPEKSIAVLPFENLSEEKQNEYFTDGVQDEILSDLAKIADLKVISRTSVMQYKSGIARNLRKIGEELGVAHVVEGSVQRSANKIRVIAQLIDARNDAHLWAQTYDRDLADVFAIQSEIAKAIADQLQAKLSPTEKKAIEQPPTTDLAAFDLYSRAKSLLLTANFSATNEPDVRKAIELLDEAVKRDPSFFDAYCQLAYAHESLYAISGSDHTPARLTLVEDAVQAATRLRPDAAETHLARAHISTSGRATMPAPSPNWRLRGERYPTIRVSSNSPATFCGGVASRRKVCTTCSARWSWTRVTFIFSNRSRLVTKTCSTMPRQSLPWIGC
jgi:TolB-like protein